MESIQLNLSDAQMKKLLSGQDIQVKRNDIGNGTELMFGKMNANKLATSYNKGKGMRLGLTQEELKKNNSLMGSGFGKVKKGFNKVKKGARKASDAVAKADKHIQKADNVIQKIDRGVDRFEFLKDAGIPVVSDLYGAIDAATDQAAIASGQAANASGQVQRTNEQLRKTANNPSVSNIRKSTQEVQATNDLRGSGNPHMPRARKTGGSFRPVGGSFRTLDGRGFPVYGRGNVRVFEDESNVVRPGHNSFNPVEVESYSGKRCAHCGK